jgi:hypothetical protein
VLARGWYTGALARGAYTGADGARFMGCATLGLAGRMLVGACVPCGTPTLGLVSKGRELIGLAGALATGADTRVAWLPPID